ncbi:MAG: hypothetical protein AB7O59_06030 [Pirellulales bacterium]
MSEAIVDHRQGSGDGLAEHARLRASGTVSGGLLRGANMLRQVARTYVARWRFWIFGAIYLLFTFAWAAWSEVMVGQQILLSVVLATPLGCFLALHLRRQFGTPAAKVVPHFAPAHLTVGGAASLTMWAAVPALQAWMLGVPVWGPIGAHAVAGLFLALVVCVRQAIVLLALVPITIVAVNLDRLLQDQEVLGRALRGDQPALSATLIALAVVAHLVAARVLLGLADQSVHISDDFALDTSSTERAGGRLDELLLRFRDGVIRRRLADAGFGMWAVQRWRVPGAISLAQIAIAVAAGTFVVVMGRWASGQSAGAMLGLIITLAGMMVAPFNGWHLRRGAMASELMRPVTRHHYAGQVALAVAWDVAVWTVVASVFSLLVMVGEFGLQSELIMAGGVYLAFLWSAAVFVYGLGLATFRSRYWLPLMIGAGLIWTLLVAYAVSMVAFQLLTERRHIPSLLPGVYLFAWILGGVALAAFTIGRWLRSDCA